MPKHWMRKLMPIVFTGSTAISMGMVPMAEAALSVLKAGTNTTPPPVPVELAMTAPKMPIGPNSQMWEKNRAMSPTCATSSSANTVSNRPDVNPDAPPHQRRHVAERPGGAVSARRTRRARPGDVGTRV